MWGTTPPAINICGTPYPDGAQPLADLSRTAWDRLSSPVRFRFTGCREGTPLVEVRFLWWHPATWWLRAASMLARGGN